MADEGGSRGVWAKRYVWTRGAWVRACGGDCREVADEDVCVEGSGVEWRAGGASVRSGR